MPIYLDHASTCWPKAAGVSAAMVAALNLAGSSRRGMGAGSRSADRIADDLRRGLAAIVGEPDPRRVVLTGGATASLNMAILGVVLAARTRGHTPRVVTTQVEHNAVRRPLLALAARREIDLVTIPADTTARVSAQRVIDAAQSAHTDLVAMMSASNVTGVRQPVSEVGEALKGSATLFLVDASQTAGPECERVACDLLAFGAHKRFSGPPGVGALVVGAKVHPIDLGATASPLAPDRSPARLAPTILGGAGYGSEDADMPVGLPARFEPGTMNTPAFAGWLAAIEGVPEGAASRHAAVCAVADGLRASLRGLGETVRVYGDRRPGQSEPIVAFTIQGYAPDEVAAALESEFGILVRAGLHCAPGAHEAMGTKSGGGTVRVSLGAATTALEVEEFVRAVARIVEG